MALRQLVYDGDPILKKKCRPVTKFDDRLGQLLDDMCETMMEENGMGLAACQVGVLRRAFVVLDESSLPHLRREAEQAEGEAPEGAGPGEEAPGEEPWEETEPRFFEFINPEILETEGEKLGYEGCLSFPGEFAAILRPTRVVVKAQDRHGEEFQMEATGMTARCICHENNHLDGITIDDLAEYYFDPETPHELDSELETEEEILEATE